MSLCEDGALAMYGHKVTTCVFVEVLAEPGESTAERTLGEVLCARRQFS